MEYVVIVAVVACVAIAGAVCVAVVKLSSVARAVPAQWVQETTTTEYRDGDAGDGDEPVILNPRQPTAPANVNN